MTPKLLRALRSQEYALADRVRESLREESRLDLVHQVDQHLGALETVAQAASGYPSPLVPQSLGEQERNIQTLIERLTLQNSFSIELVLPTRAITCHSFVMARLNFFRMLRHVLDQLAKAPDGRSDMHKSVEDAIADCVTMRAAEEILKAITCSEESEKFVRERAALLLLHLWHNASSRSTGELLPVLAAVWAARRRAHVALGTMLGASELFELLTQGCDERFLGFLTRDKSSPEQVAAFREFLFGLSFEELEEIRETRENETISVEMLLRESPEQVRMGIYQAGDDAERFFLFFMKRHLRATYRAEMNLPGPKQTAEQYVLNHLISEQWESLGINYKK